MTSIFKPYLNYFIKLFLFDISFQLALLILLIITLHFCYKVSTKKQENGVILLFSYKIYNFKFNIFLIVIYLLINIYLLIYLRIQYFNKTIDLRALIQLYLKLIKSLPFINSVLITVIFFFLWLVILFLFKKFHQYFLNEIKKRYFFISSISTRQAYLVKLNIYSYSLNKFYSFIISKTIPFFEYFQKSTIFFLAKRADSSFILFKHIVDYILFKFFSHFMLSYFFYELIYNNGILSTVFNKLLFVYIFYKIYIRCCNIGDDQCAKLNTMIFEMYYRFYSLKYVNLPEEWQNHIYDYVRNGLCENNKINPIDYLQLYLKHIYTTHDGIEYFNMENATFIEENNESKDVVEGNKDPMDIAHHIRQMYPKQKYEK